MGTLTWLHISDIHFRPQMEWKDATARRALLDHLRAERKKHKLDIDLVFCTGDIAFGELPGQPLRQQYEMAERFFDELLAVCGSEGAPLARDRLFVVPGNHDVDRDAVDAAAQESWTRWGSPTEAYRKSPDIAKDFAALKSSPASALQRLKPYGEFAARYLPHQQPTPGHHHYSYRLRVNGIEVGIAGFNSAWTCYGDEDDRTLWLGAEPQFDDMRAALVGAGLSFGLIHHPHDWFNEAERSLVRDRAERDFDFWLHGHAHDLRIREEGKKLVLAGAGALTGQHSEEFGYNIVRIDTGANTGIAYLYHWDNRRSDWKTLTISEVADDGKQPFRLRRDTADQPASDATATADDMTLQLRRDMALPPPAVCLERAAELGRLAAWSTRVPPVPVLICGFGGLGKTEIAVRYLHSAEAQRQFGSRRYFVSVEGLENTPAGDLPSRFWSGLALALFGRAAQSLGGERLIEELRRSFAEQAQPALLVLDNFETVVLIDTHFAVAALEQLAGLAAQGLTLHITLREPLPNLGIDHVRMPLQPLKDASAARRMFCHWMRADPDAILGAEDGAALDHLLELAEGWPIQLQMLGVLAEIEGLRSLAARCPTAAQMAAVMAGQDQPDRHRHSHLSCRMTYESPGLGESARRLLRCLACFPDGVPDEWLSDWPEQDAVRELQPYKLLLEAQGEAGETRRKLPTPLRDFLRHTHGMDDDDRAALAQAWDVWWRRTAPELFDTGLPRRAPAVYRDLHEQEFVSQESLRSSGTLGIRAAMSLGRALNNLRLWVGNVSDWRDWLAESQRVILLAQELFGTAERAERFARLLAGSQSIAAVFKRQIVDALKSRTLTPEQIDTLEEAFLAELGAWAWLFGSHDFSERLSNCLAEGRVCLEASAAELLAAIDEIDSENERIVLLHTALKRHWENEDRTRLETALEATLAASVSAPSLWVQAERSSGQDIAELMRRAVELKPDYGRAWSELAARLPPDEADAAWREVRRCAEAHLSETHRRGWVPDVGRGTALLLLYRACVALGKGDAAKTAATAMVGVLNAAAPVRDQLDVAICCLDAGMVDAASTIGLRVARVAMRILDVEDRRSIEKLSWTFFPHAPQHALAIRMELFGCEVNAAELVAASSMLFHAGLPALGQGFCRAAAAIALNAGQANNLAYDLATHGDDAAETLALAIELAERGFAQESTTAHAETLLCACLRSPMDDESAMGALGLLLAIDDASSEEDLQQLAGLIFDTDRYAGRERLARWLAVAPAPAREGVAGRALLAWLGDEAPGDEAADALLTKLDGLRAQIAEQIAAEDADRERLAEHRNEMANIAQGWLAAMNSETETPGD